MSHTVEVGRLGAVADLERFVDALGQTATGEPLVIEFKSLESTDEPSRVRTRPEAVLLLVRALAARAAEQQISVSLPLNEGLRNQLARGGLFFALANAPLGLAEDAEFPHTLRQQWAQPWMAGSPEWRQTLFSPEEYGETVLPAEPVQPDLLTFINPHRADSTDVAEQIAEDAARPWLNRLIGRSQRLTRRDREWLVSRVGLVVEQLVKNIRDHARLRRGGSSLVQVFRTAGGGEQSVNRLYVAVLDDGVGIVKSVRESFGVEGTSAEVLATTVAGRLPGYGRDRGEGYAAIGRAIARYGGGRVFAACGDENGHATWAEYRPSSNSLQSGRLALPLKGTVVVAQLHLESA